MSVIDAIEELILKRAEVIRQLELKPDKTASEVSALNQLNYHHQLSLAKLHAVKSGKRSSQYDVDKFEAAADLVTERTRAPVTDEVKSLLKDIASKSK